MFYKIRELNIKRNGINMIRLKNMIKIILRQIKNLIENQKKTNKRFKFLNSQKDSLVS